MAELRSMRNIGKEMARKLAAVGIDTPDKLREAAALRLDHPELNLAQLGALCAPAVSKSALNHRMRKLLELAEAAARRG